MKTATKELIVLGVLFVVLPIGYYVALGDSWWAIVVLTFITIFIIWAKYLEELDIQHNILKINRGDTWPKKPKK